MFFTLFVIGAVGFLTMALLSFGHVGAIRGGHHAVSTGSQTHALHGTHVPHVGAQGATHPANTSPQPGVRAGGQVLASLIPTPIDVFSYCLGFGAAGMILRTTFSGPVLIGVAIAFALAYNLLLIHPFMALAMRFVSRESDGLEGAVATEAEAVGTFDAQGRGIVRLTLDGQIVQLLATLDEAEHARGVGVARGDKLVVLEVDPHRNTCRVSRDLAA